MVYTTHLWWNWGWLIVVLTTLDHFRWETSESSMWHWKKPLRSKAVKCPRVHRDADSCSWQRRWHHAPLACMEQKGGTNGHINISETVLVLQRSHESNSKGATAENFGENGLHFFFVCLILVRFDSLVQKIYFCLVLIEFGVLRGWNMVIPAYPTSIWNPSIGHETILDSWWYDHSPICRIQLLTTAHVHSAVLKKYIYIYI